AHPARRRARLVDRGDPEGRHRKHRAWLYAVRPERALPAFRARLRARDARRQPVGRRGPGPQAILRVGTCRLYLPRTGWRRLRAQARSTLMSLTHRLSRTALAAVACLVAFAAVASEPHVTDAQTLATLDKVLAGDHRSAQNKARDAWRHPKETLTFFGLRQDMTVLEIWPGGGGWYTE